MAPEAHSATPAGSTPALLPPEVPAGAFTVTRRIRFSHSDPAGIVYFPNYFDMINGLIEDWFIDALGMDYARFILEERSGMPIVHAECDFGVPSRMGDMLGLSLIVDRLGRSSLGYQVFGHAGGIVRLKAKIVTVMIDRDSGKSAPIPDDLCARVAAYQKRCGSSS